MFLNSIKHGATLLRKKFPLNGITTLLLEVKDEISALFSINAKWHGGCN
jgi:hypothetical protein